MKQLFLILPLSAILAACGGGGDHPPPPTQPKPVPLIAGAIETDLELPEPMSQPDGEPVDASAQETSLAEPAGGSADFAVRDYPSTPVGIPAPADGGQAAAGLGTEAQAEATFNVLYVAPGGADSNPGTLARPFRSLMRAARAARAGSKVLVAPGLYTGGFRSNASGTAGARILYVSTTKWGAKIVPPRNSPNKTAWDNRGSHVDIVGFEVDGRAHQGGKVWMHGIYNGGSHVSIRNNRVHHIAQSAQCTRAGGAAINVDSYYRGVQASVIANLVHDIGPAGCRYVHGIYVSTSARIQNNVVYRVAEGGIHMWHDASNVIVTNNTVTAARTGIIIGGGNYYHRKGPNDHTAVYSNIVYDNRMGISEQGQTGRNNTYRNNLVYQNSAYDWRLQNGVTHTGTVSSAPLFVDNSRGGNPSLRLSASSPAIGRATPTHAESTDFAGRPRDATAGYDIGALQH